MRKTQWITPITFRRGTAVILLLALLACAIPAGADTAPKNDIDNMTGETQIILAEAALQKRRMTDDSLDDIHVHQNGQIFGRGISDEPSGAEPDYIGLVGYAAVANNTEVSLDADATGFPWTVPAYMLFEKRWYYTKSLQHKTGVLVVRQMLKDAGNGRYTGRLQVIRLNTMETCWMDVENFVTVPYWFYPPRRAVRYGSTVAAYRRQGNRIPTDEEGNPVEVAEDTGVMIPGYGVWDKRPPAGSQMIPGIIYEEKVSYVPMPPEKTESEENGEENGEADSGGDGEVRMKEVREVITTVLLFPEEDLTMIY